MTTKERLEKYGITRGFNNAEETEYDQILGICSTGDTIDNHEYQNRLFNMIDCIIHKENLDYMSKMDKLYLIIATNMTWQKWWNKDRTKD